MSHDHLLRYLEEEKRIEIYRVHPDGSEVFLTSIAFADIARQVSERGLAAFAHLLGENLLMDSPVTRRLLMDSWAAEIELENVGEIIASRTLHVTEGEHANREVRVLFGKPQPSPDGDSYYAPYQIIGIGSEKVRYGAGCDSVEALLHALQQVGAPYLCGSEVRGVELAG